MQNFWHKGIHSLFWILASRGKKTKKSKNPHPPHEKFGILDGTKHTHENFGILHFIIPGVFNFPFHPKNFGFCSIIL
jgi:hypothetical protein